ncbi:MAG: hypothetical protein JWN62_2014 [Acidimicrobiales bacterium]|nr:hypothetical protein [Acidimicrobiales bacterium]
MAAVDDDGCTDPCGSGVVTAELAGAVDSFADVPTVADDAVGGAELNGVVLVGAVVSSDVGVV